MTKLEMDVQERYGDVPRDPRLQYPEQMKDIKLGKGPYVLVALAALAAALIISVVR